MIIANNNGVVKPLEDISSSGRVNPWREKKLENLELSEVYQYISDNTQCGWYWMRKAERLRDCGTKLLFDLMTHQETGEVKKRLAGANFCRVRLCPMCGWRRARKTQAQMIQILQHCENYRFLFLTLTVPNCSGADLSETLDRLFSAWNRLQRTPEFKWINKYGGWYRALEVTHNLRDDSFHPHFHVILAVPPDYFDQKFYVTHDRFLAMWQKAYQDDSITQVDIRAVRTIKRKPESIIKAVAECCKYTVKPEEILIPGNMKWSAELVQILDPALHKRRLIAFGGVLKKIHAELNLDDPIDGDIATAGDTPDGWKKIDVQQLYVWHSGYSQYVSR